MKDQTEIGRIKDLDPKPPLYAYAGTYLSVELAPGLAPEEVDMALILVAFDTLVEVCNQRYGIVAP
jgi:hypothetical protein